MQWRGRLNNMPCELSPTVKTAIDVFSDKKKDNFYRVMEVAHLLLDGVVGTVVCGINELFQTYALIQCSHDQRKIVEYTNSLKEMELKAAVEMKRLDVEKRQNQQQYDIQKKVLTLYVDKKYQNYVDMITESTKNSVRNIEAERCRTIREIDKYTMRITEGMDRKYREILRQEEIICAVYKDFIQELSRQGISRQKLAYEISCHAIDKSHKLSDCQFEIIFEAVCKMTEPQYVTFNQFVQLHNEIIERV